MKKRRVNRKSLLSPLPMASSPTLSQSPKSNTVNKTASVSKRSYEYRKPTTSVLFSSSLLSPPPMNNGNKTLGSISDLNEMAVSHLDNLKRNLIDRSHSEILKDLEASHTRLQKRFKVFSIDWTTNCQILNMTKLCSIAAYNQF